MKQVNHAKIENLFVIFLIQISLVSLSERIVEKESTDYLGELVSRDFSNQIGNFINKLELMGISETTTLSPENNIVIEEIGQPPDEKNYHLCGRTRISAKKSISGKINNKRNLEEKDQNNLQERILSLVRSEKVSMNSYFKKEIAEKFLTELSSHSKIENNLELFVSCLQNFRIKLKYSKRPFADEEMVNKMSTDLSELIHALQKIQLEEELEMAKETSDPTRLYDRIVGGEEAEPHAWPWQVAIMKRKTEPNNTGEFITICGGSIVMPFHVISAAHCFFDRSKNASHNPDNFQIIAGSNLKNSNISNPTTKSQIQKLTLKNIIINPEYDPELIQNDIAILTLKSPFIFNEYVRSCCLPGLEQVSKNELKCFATGWGLTKENNRTQFLNQVQLPIYSIDECRQKFFGSRIKKGMICAGFPDGGKDTCQGDSGGPLVCYTDTSWNLYGITSWGIGCGEANKPGIYTDVSQYLDWIDYVTKD